MSDLVSLPLLPQQRRMMKFTAILSGDQGRKVAVEVEARCASDVPAALERWQIEQHRRHDRETYHLELILLGEMQAVGGGAGWGLYVGARTGTAVQLRDRGRSESEGHRERADVG